MDIFNNLRSSLMDLPSLGCGSSAVLFALPDTSVVKIPYGHSESAEQVAVEREIYRRLGPHDNIMRLLFAHNDMIILEQHVCTLREHLQHVWNLGEVPEAHEVFQWAKEVSEALYHAHLHHVLQVDIGAHNVMVNPRGDSKLFDFAGSSIDGSAPWVSPRPYAAYPHMPNGMPSIRSEIFALGSMFYEMETTRIPYSRKSADEIEILFKRHVFPDNTSSLVMGEIILKCWKAQYRSVGEVLEDIARVRREHMEARQAQRANTDEEVAERHRNVALYDALSFVAAYFRRQ